MKKISVFFKRNLFFIVVIIVVAFAFKWDAASAFLARQGVPSWGIGLGAVVFFILALELMTKIGILTSYPKSSKLIKSSIQEIFGAPLEELLLQPPITITDPTHYQSETLPFEAAKLVEWDATLQSLGIMPVTDFYTESKVRKRSFGRLYVSEKHQCRLIMTQVFSQRGMPVTTLRCAFFSVLDSEPLATMGDWTLSTSNGKTYEGAGIQWAARGPHGLWSRHPEWDIAQLLSFHLERREQMMQTLHLSLITDLSWECYCTYVNRSLPSTRARLLRKPSIIIWFEAIFCKNKTEWWGDYQKVIKEAA